MYFHFFIFICGDSNKSFCYSSWAIPNALSFRPTLSSLYKGEIPKVSEPQGSTFVLNWLSSFFPGSIGNVHLKASVDQRQAQVGKALAVIPRPEGGDIFANK